MLKNVTSKVGKKTDSRNRAVMFSNKLQRQMQTIYIFRSRADTSQRCKDEMVHSMHTMLDLYLRLPALVNAVLKEHNDFKRLLCKHLNCHTVIC